MDWEIDFQRNLKDWTLYFCVELLLNFVGLLELCWVVGMLDQ